MRTSEARRWAMGRSKVGEEPKAAVAVYGVDPGHEGAVARWRLLDGKWLQSGIWRMGGKTGLREDRSARDELLWWTEQDKAQARRHLIGMEVRAVVEWPSIVTAMSSRRVMLGQGEGVGWAAGLLQGAGLEVWYVEPQVWRAVVGVRTPAREALARITKDEEEVLGQEEVLAIRKGRRRARAKEAKTLLLEAGMAKLREVVPGWSADHEGVIDAALIGLADIQTTSRVGWRRL